MMKILILIFVVPMPILCVEADYNILSQSWWVQEDPLSNAKPDLDKLKIILAQPNLDINQRDQDGTALHAAVSGGHSEMVLMLLLNDIDQTLQNRCGRTARQLINTAIDPYNESFDYACDYLVCNAFEDAVHYKALTAGINNKDLRIFEQYVGNVRFDHQGYKGNTLLHVAVAAKNIDAIKFLYLIYPSLAFIRNYQGQTPLAMAEGDEALCKCFSSGFEYYKQCCRQNVVAAKVMQPYLISAKRNAGYYSYFFTGPYFCYWAFLSLIFCSFPCMFFYYNPGIGPVIGFVFCFWLMVRIENSIKGNLGMKIQQIIVWIMIIYPLAAALSLIASYWKSTNGNAAK